MSEILSRLRCAWYVLRGWSVMKGVVVSHGEVIFYGRKVALSNKSGIDGCQIYAPDMEGLPEMRGADVGYNEATVSGPDGVHRFSRAGHSESWQPLS
jgi:hypothetical protein